jgi:DNA-binding PadR family transcriptional regulator
MDRHFFLMSRGGWPPPPPGPPPPPEPPGPGWGPPGPGWGPPPPDPRVWLSRGRHPGRPFPRGRRGDVRAAILALLAEEARNGYQIMQEIAERSQGLWRPGSGSVYPALQQLEDEGLVRVEEREERRRYELTEAGREYVRDHDRELRAPWEAVAEQVDDRTMALMEEGRQLMMALTQVAHAGGPEQVREARRLVAGARRALYQLLANAEPEDDEEEQVGGPEAGEAP